MTSTLGRRSAVSKCHFCEEDLVDWVAYGTCAHRGVCSTCAICNRMFCRDKRCYQCTKKSSMVYVTKHSVNFFDTIKEGQLGPYWFHEKFGALFTDYDEYSRILEIGKLVCNSCDETNFDCIGLLMAHLFEQHRLYLCIACLVSRSQFVREHKLFTKDELNQHIRTGDSQADGTMTERKGFRGHPRCELCMNPFYGEDNVFVHMSSRCDCHICDKIRPGIVTKYVEDHFLETHVGSEESYESARFSIIRAFTDDDHLEWHVDRTHLFSSEESDSPPLSAPAPPVRNLVLPSSSRSDIKAFIGKLRDLLLESLKITSGDYRHGKIDARTYLDYLKKHGLADLVLDIANFCPDEEKREEIIQAYNDSLTEGE